MRRPLAIALLSTAALVAAVAFFAVFTAPRPALRLGEAPAGLAIGAYHVHSSRSDGTGSPEAIARAAAEAGLAFVIFTDHGDGTRPPAAPEYVSGVLCIDAFEVNTANGHVVALDVTRPSPFPLAGEARDVIEDVHRLGGIAIAAHPDSPDTTLRWRGAPVYDGLEWMNADSEWRDDSPRHLLAAAIRSTVRGPESIASLFSRPAFTLQRWDAALRTRPVIALAALDAHARFGWTEDEEPRSRAALSWPPYRTMFRTMAQAVMLDRPLSGDPRVDAGAILSALSSGRTFSVVTALAAPASLEFFAEQAGRRAGSGQRLDPFDPSHQTRFVAAVPQAAGSRLTLSRSGQSIAEGRGRLEVTRALAPGAYRVEAYLPGSPLPWIVSNPIYLGPLAPPPVAAPDPELPGGTLTPVPADTDWRIERDNSSTGSISKDEGLLKFDFALGGGRPAGQYAAAVLKTPEDTGLDRITFLARASGPMRVSVQVRLPGGSDGQRWRRSVYLDQTPREVVVRLADMEPVGATTTLRPIVARVQALLIVVDTLNTALGTAGTVWMKDVRLGVVPAAGEGGAPAAASIRSGR